MKYQTEIKTCVCGVEDPRLLCIDHVKGNGAEERRLKGGNGMIRMMLNKIKSGSREYQLLCLNHNWLKALVNKEV